MTDEVREWLAKATNDLESAQGLISGERVHHDLVCFLCQQGIEKLMKGALIARGIVPPKTHDLVVLHAQLRGVQPSWNWDDAELRRLSRGAVVYRYPGE